VTLPPSPDSPFEPRPTDPTTPLPPRQPGPPPTGSGYGGPSGPSYGDPTNQPQPGSPYERSLPVPTGPSGPPLVIIGDITVEQHRIVTPAGVMPAKGAVWTAMDMSRTEEKIPTYAIVLTVLACLLVCLFGLLFLLIKEKRTEGFVQVTVNSGGRMHSALVAVRSPQQVSDILARVNYARSVCM